ncbi:hypothetical protein HanRHA438_Chr11g0518751 [Helianthus annuus]|nr:hypothetical protein HanRHA438_Chr11g0518751 [Helianthus annuus]
MLKTNFFKFFSPLFFIYTLEGFLTKKSKTKYIKKQLKKRLNLFYKNNFFLGIVSTRFYKEKC